MKRKSSLRDSTMKRRRSRGRNSDESEGSGDQSETESTAYAPMGVQEGLIPVITLRTQQRPNDVSSIDVYTVQESADTFLPAPPLPAARASNITTFTAAPTTTRQTRSSSRKRASLSVDTSASALYDTAILTTSNSAFSPANKDRKEVHERYEAQKQQTVHEVQRRQQQQEQFEQQILQQQQQQQQQLIQQQQQKWQQEQEFVLRSPRAQVQSAQSEISSFATTPANPSYNVPPSTYSEASSITYTMPSSVAPGSTHISYSVEPSLIKTYVAEENYPAITPAKAPRARKGSKKTTASTTAATTVTHASTRPQPVNAHLIPGHWEMIHAEQHGADGAALMASKIELFMSAGTYEVRSQGVNADNGTYVLDGGDYLTLTGTEGPNKGRAVQCIYNVIASDLLRICYGLDGARPTSFSTKNSANYVACYRRVRADSGQSSTAQRVGGDKALLPGGWELIHAERFGADASDLLTVPTQLELSPNQYMLSLDNNSTDRGSFTLVGPNAFDLESTVTPGNRVSCLYKLVGSDMLKVCYGMDGTRPVMFTTSEENNNWTGYYRRVKHHNNTRDVERTVRPAEPVRSPEIVLETPRAGIFRTLLKYLFWILSALCLYALFDYLFVSPFNAEVYPCPAGLDCTRPTRRGLLQGQAESKLLFTFLAPLYNLLQPWHWTEQMREKALKRLSLSNDMQVVEVGSGNGFTTQGLLKDTHSVTVVDLFPTQLGAAKISNEKVVGDAEHLPFDTQKFDRYVSANSIQFWPHPQRALDEAARVLKKGGKALIVGPARAADNATYFGNTFADMWGFHPSRDNYKALFINAGFHNISILDLAPEYDEHTRGGLISSVAVTGVKPLHWTRPARDRELVKTPLTTWDYIKAVPRFLLGTLIGGVYALQPVWNHIVHNWFSDSALAAFVTLFLLPLSILAYYHILPTNWKPYGASDALFSGVAKLYDNSSPIWEKVWGEHMHTGYYDLGESGKGWSKEDHHEAQVRMMQEFLALWDVPEPGSTVRILDCGCGVGGSSRFLYTYLTQLGYKVQVTGITLSSYQCKRAQELTHAHPLIPRGPVNFRVANALHLGADFPDGTFDLVWSLESGEHIPEKEAWLAEMSRVLKDGGMMLCATWCHRPLSGGSLTSSETRLLGRICKIYSLPAFVEPSVYEYAGRRNGLVQFTGRSWTNHIRPFWPAVIRAALRPTTLLKIILSLPFGGWTTVKGAIAAVLMQQGFAAGTLDYSVFTMTKLG